MTCVTLARCDRALQSQIAACSVNVPRHDVSLMSCIAADALATDRVQLVAVSWRTTDMSASLSQQCCPLDGQRRTKHDRYCRDRQLLCAMDRKPMPCCLLPQYMTLDVVVQPISRTEHWAGAHSSSRLLARRELSDSACLLASAADCRSSSFSAAIQHLQAVHRAQDKISFQAAISALNRAFVSRMTFELSSACWT